MTVAFVVARLIPVKRPVQEESIILIRMSVRRMHPLGMSIAVMWLRAFVVLVIVAAGFAPVANAVCDLEHLAGRPGRAEPALASIAVPPSPAVPHDEDGSCCDPVPEAVATQAKTPVADGALSQAGAHLFAVGRTLFVRTASLGPIRWQRALAPPEPAFRRVPRLLL